MDVSPSLSRENKTLQLSARAASQEERQRSANQDLRDVYSPSSSC